MNHNTNTRPFNCDKQPLATSCLFLSIPPPPKNNLAPNGRISVEILYYEQLLKSFEKIPMYSKSDK
jgi:hypothetical protein